VNESTSFTNRGVCEKRSDIYFSIFLRAIEQDLQSYLGLDIQLQVGDFQCEKILENVGIALLSEKFQIQICA